MRNTSQKYTLENTLWKLRCGNQSLKAVGHSFQSRGLWMLCNGPETPTQSESVTYLLTTT